MTSGTSTPTSTPASTTPAAPRPDPTGDLLAAAEHEQVTVFHDRDTGLRAIIALHSTALGPGLGGTRFYPYPTFAAALADVLALSKAMSFKNALAGLDHGGGKAVIIGDPASEKTHAVLRAYGRFVESLDGRYVTACDVGTSVVDMDVIAETTRFATGRSEEHGGAGDSSVLTAFGVFQGMRAAAERVWGTPTLATRRVGIAGVGKVGRVLAAYLLDDGADIVVTDVNPEATRSVAERFPQVEVAPDAATLCAMAIDVYSPCALGRALDPVTVESLTARIVCGGANNQLVIDGRGGTADRLQERGILYAPDFLVNAGGVIQVSDELLGFDFERAKLRTAGIFDATARVLDTAAERGVTPEAAAAQLAEERMAGAAPLGMWSPPRAGSAGPPMTM